MTVRLCTYNKYFKIQDLDIIGVHVNIASGTIRIDNPPKLPIVSIIIC